MLEILQDSKARKRFGMSDVMLLPLFQRENSRRTSSNLKEPAYLAHTLHIGRVDDELAFYVDFAEHKYLSWSERTLKSKEYDKELRSLVRNPIIEGNVTDFQLSQIGFSGTRFLTPQLIRSEVRRYLN